MGKSKAGIAGLCLVGLIFGAGCATTSAKGPSDEEQVAGVVAGWKSAFEANDLDAIMSFYSENYNSSQGGNKAGLRDFLDTAIKRDYLKDAKVDITAAEVKVEGGMAQVAPVRLSGLRGGMNLKLDLKKEADGWRIVSSDTV